MDQYHRAKRFCTAVILCALTFRLFSTVTMADLTAWLTEPHIASFLTYLETGRIVRFSASHRDFWGFASESPAPWQPEEAAVPVFSPEDGALTELYYACSLRPDVQTLLTQPLSWDLTGEGPAVLILHTHTTESYTCSGEDYVETSDYRTLNEEYNMLSIGDRVGDILEGNGITVIHDRTLHDYPSYNGSYDHARKSIEEYLRQYPGIRLVLDLHRDATDGTNGQLRTLATVGGKTAAQLMLVMGTDESGLTHDNWQANLSLALKLQVQLEKQAPGITRPTILRAQRFNQDLSTGALLVEVGAAGNTHTEALLAAEELAKAIVALSRGIA